MAVQDNYLSCESYANAPDSTTYPGFKSWYNDADSLWYFAAVTNTGRVVLRSEGYTTESARNNGIESVMRNRDIEERYSVVKDEEDGNWYVVLKAGNRQEIARSCAYESESAANAGRAACSSTYIEPTVVAASLSESGKKTSAQSIEDYLSCDEYANQPASSYEGFSSFYNEADGQHYFALVDNDGNVLLRSEGYTSEAGRNNGIESVNRNRDLSERYGVVEENGAWYVSLKAGNRQEIARSCAYDSEAAARALIARCSSSYSSKSSSSSSSFVSETIISGGETITTISTEEVVVSSSETSSSSFASETVVETSTPITVTSSIVEEKVVETSTPITVTSSTVVESSAVIEDYLPCEAYSGKLSTKYEGFTGFHDAETGLYYFSMVDENGHVILRSEGYTSEAGRNNGIESVIRNRDIKERWVQSQDGKGHFFSLRAGNRQEIARTCHYESESALLSWWMPLSSVWTWGKKGEIVEVKSESSVESIQIASTAVATPVSIQVEEHFVQPKVVIPEPEPEPVIIPEPEIVEEKTIEVEEVAAVVGTAALLTEIEVPKAPEPEPIVVETKKEYTPQWKKKEEEVVVEKEKVVVHTKPVEKIVPPPVAAYTETEAAVGGGSDWWKWLLGLLLLGLLAWLLMRGCGGCNKPTPPPPAKVEVTPPAAAVDTVKKEAPAPVVAAAKCNCTGNSDPLFNTGTGTPKSLSRLGTNPEFGDSHGLSPEQFYNKLVDRAAANPADKKFLDRVFKGMGYKGFADAKPEMFSAVSLPAGTEGNIGYSKAHKTLFARLDTNERDLMAFRIKSANGCDFHFMKTCGNHMFFCPN